MAKMTYKSKELMFRFHIRDIAINELAEGLKLPKQEAYDLYKDNIIAIIKEFKAKGIMAKIQFELPKDEEEEVAKPEPVKEEPKPKEVPKEAPKEEPIKVEKEAPKEKESRLKIMIPDEVAKVIIKDEAPLVIENGDYAKDVAKYLIGRSSFTAEVLAEIPDHLPPVSIIDKALAMDIEEAYIFVRPVFDSEKNLVTVKIKHMN